MKKNSNRHSLIVELVIYIGFIVLLSLILNSVFKGVVLGKDPSGTLIYDDGNHLFAKISIGFGMLVNLILITTKTFKIIKDGDYVQKELIKDLSSLVFILLVLIIPIVLFDRSVDKYNGFAFGLSFSLIIIIIAIITFKIINYFKPEKEEITIAAVTEGAILAALAIVLSLVSKMIGFLEMPEGGSFSLSMLPLMIYGFRRGAKTGFIMGFVYGFLNFITDGYLLHWGSLFFDYFIPFALVGAIPGLFSKKAQEGTLVSIFLGVLLAGFARYLLHSFSGVIFFSENALDSGAWFYSFIIYNLPYMLVSTIGSLIFILILRKDFIVKETKIR